MVNYLPVPPSLYNPGTETNQTIADRARSLSR